MSERWRKSASVMQKSWNGSGVMMKWHDWLPMNTSDYITRAGTPAYTLYARLGFIASALTS